MRLFNETPFYMSNLGQALTLTVAYIFRFLELKVA